MMSLFRSHPRFTNHNVIVPRRTMFLLFVLLALVGAFSVRADEIVPFVLQDSLYRTNLGISNLDLLPADVSILLYDNNGQLTAQGVVQIPGLGFVNLREVVYFIFGCPSELPFEGFVRLQTTRRIVTFASQIQN